MQKNCLLNVNRQNNSSSVPFMIAYGIKINSNLNVIWGSVGKKATKNVAITGTNDNA